MGEFELAIGEAKQLIQILQSFPTDSLFKNIDNLILTIDPNLAYKSHPSDQNTYH